MPLLISHLDTHDLLNVSARCHASVFRESSNFVETQSFPRSASHPLNQQLGDDDMDVAAVRLTMPGPRWASFDADGNEITQDLNGGFSSSSGTVLLHDPTSQDTSFQDDSQSEETPATSQNSFNASTDNSMNIDPAPIEPALRAPSRLFRRRQINVHLPTINDVNEATLRSTRIVRHQHRPAQQPNAQSQRRRNPRRRRSPRESEHFVPRLRREGAIIQDAARASVDSSPTVTAPSPEYSPSEYSGGSDEERELHMATTLENQFSDIMTYFRLRYRNARPAERARLCSVLSRLLTSYDSNSDMVFIMLD